MIQIDPKDVWVPVGWPESQNFIGRSHCYLISDDIGYTEFGDSAYFVRLDVYDRVMGNVNKS